MIEALVLIDSSCLLKEPTELLKEYRKAAKETNPITRYEKLKGVLEDMYAGPSRLLLVAVDLFDLTIEKPGAKQAFESSIDDSTKIQIDIEGFK